MDRVYQPTPDGYCGDEDNGQTSAWYVFSALGFYPVTPATDEYVLGAPLFKEVTIQLPSGKTIEIHAPDNSRENRYIKSATVNGKSYGRNFVNHSELVDDAVLYFEMTDKPNKQRGTNPEDFPFSLSSEE